MALIRCTECGHMISNRARKCPQCGCNYKVSVNANSSKKESNAKLYVFILYMAVLCGIVVLFAINKNTPDSSNDVEKGDIEIVKSMESIKSSESSDAEDLEEEAVDVCEDADVIMAKVSEITDWGMIKPVKLLSDEAYFEFKQSNPEWTEQTREGAFESETPTFIIEYVSTYGPPYDGNYRMVGRYHSHENGLSLDFNAQSVDGVWYVQLGHGSQKSYAILHEVEGGGYEGTWGSKDKHIWLTD